MSLFSLLTLMTDQQKQRHIHFITLNSFSLFLPFSDLVIQCPLLSKFLMFYFTYKKIYKIFAPGLEVHDGDLKLKINEFNIPPLYCFMSSFIQAYVSIAVLFRDHDNVYSKYLELENPNIKL